MFFQLAQSCINLMFSNESTQLSLLGNMLHVSANSKCHRKRGLTSNKVLLVLYVLQENVNTT